MMVQVLCDVTTVRPMMVQVLCDVTTVRPMMVQVLTRGSNSLESTRLNSVTK